MDTADLLLLAALGAGGYIIYKRCSRPDARCLPADWRTRLEVARAFPQGEREAPLELRELEAEPEPEATASGARIVRPYRTITASSAATPAPTPARATPVAATATSPLRSRLIASGQIKEARS